MYHSSLTIHDKSLNQKPNHLRDIMSEFSLWFSHKTFPVLIPAPSAHQKIPRPCTSHQLSLWMINYNTLVYEIHRRVENIVSVQHILKLYFKWRCGWLLYDIVRWKRKRVWFVMKLSLSGSFYMYRLECLSGHCSINKPWGRHILISFVQNWIMVLASCWKNLRMLSL